MRASNDATDRSTNEAWDAVCIRRERFATLEGREGIGPEMRARPVNARMMITDPDAARLDFFGPDIWEDPHPEDTPQFWNAMYDDWLNRRLGSEVQFS